MRAPRWDPLHDRDERDDEFRRVADSRVDERGDRPARLLGEPLRELPDHPGERNERRGAPDYSAVELDVEFIDDHP
jgi:hypothetical protein